MLRNSIRGLLAFGVTAAIAGYIWTAFEFPFAMFLPAAVGWFAVTRNDFGARKAGLAALLGGVLFTAVFLVAIFFALTDGSPFALTAWMSATLAAAVAGAATGWLLGGSRGSLAIAAFSAGGMLVATLVAGLMRSVAPASVDVEGFAQFAYFALVQGLIGAIVGASVGAGVAWLSEHRHAASEGSSMPAGPVPSI